MSPRLALIDDAFFASAPLIVKVSIVLPHSPQQVWAAVEGDRMGSWIAVIDRATWHSARPLTVGARRSVRLLRLITLHEEHYRWDPPRRATFRVTAITLPLVSGWAEDLTVQPQPDGTTRLDWTMAIDNRPLRLFNRLHLLRLPRRAQPTLQAAAGRWLTAGISTILPSPAPGPKGRPIVP